ncbi:MAG TPA: Flp family type IVb pilin [Nocardioides sp.]|nr:Flp family type IVb pilin [Nocardioides sp.]
MTRTDRGASAIEYALLVALIAGVIIGVVIVLGGKVFGLYDLANNSGW